MIDFVRYTLNNALKVIVHQDKTTPLAIVNVLYNVGARDEDASRTGFALTFLEHLQHDAVSSSAPGEGAKCHSEIELLNVALFLSGKRGLVLRLSGELAILGLDRGVETVDL